MTQYQNHHTSKHSVQKLQQKMIIFVWTALLLLLTKYMCYPTYRTNTSVKYSVFTPSPGSGSWHPTQSALFTHRLYCLSTSFISVKSLIPFMMLSYPHSRTSHKRSYTNDSQHKPSLLHTQIEYSSRHL